jgi:manganese transport protein
MTGHEHTSGEAAGGAGRAEPEPAFAPPPDIESDARDTGGRTFARDLFSRELFRYLGPGFVVTIGFIDPGNWATNIAGGSQFGYQLLWVVSLGTLMLIFLQHLAAKLGIVTGRSLAVNVRTHTPPWLSALLGMTIAVACVATALAEYLGAALGFNLLFGLPLWAGAPLTLALVYLAILGQQYHRLERMILVFLAVIAGCYVIELFIVRPDMGAAAPHWIIPSVSSASILVALGMLGAIVMPHNLYLHSNVIQSRDWDVDPSQRTRLMRFELVDTTLSMGMGWLVNSAMIIVAAAVFFAAGIEVTSIEQASRTLEPLVGSASRLVFGIALLAAGLSSSVTASLAEANIVTGFLGRPEDPRTRAYKVGLVVLTLPAMVIIVVGVNAYQALIVSQVVLSLQLPFTIIPLLWLSRARRVMGDDRSGTITTAVGALAAALVIGLNAFLLHTTFWGG